MRIGSSSIVMSSQRVHSEQSVKKQASFTGMKGIEARPVYNSSGMKSISTVQELKFKLMEQMIASLERKRMFSGGAKDLLSGFYADSSFNVSSGINEGAVISNSGKYVVRTVSSEFYAETEVTSFQSQGSVVTEDGREFNFDISFEMSRSFSQSIETYTENEIFMCDPLVLNFKGDVAELSDQKFFFDLDCDGVEEEISYMQGNSGFLALDLNGDGKINDGRELFGTTSGDGFKDLSKYDADNNGWIDENDSIFNSLKVWTKNPDGKETLMNLKDAGVGAIYLGNANTRFSLNSITDNAVNGMIQKSGIFLMENGEVNIIQHVDFAI
ncbi:MAG: hypothetical protein ACI4EN_06815 [Butyrivibrio sp.]